ncbi:hypothetical protein C8Q76DRAFT_758355 [Earliella scabrosa]|nr:hypothetical protein C8Q76DRAFT_758355 [Earliella scabrosa]
MLLQLVLKRLVHGSEDTSIGFGSRSASGFGFAIAHEIKINVKRLVANGWCPFALTAIESYGPLLNYARTTSPFIRISATEHSSCTEHACQVHNIDDTEYKTQHTRTCQADPSCPFLSPPITPISDLLSSGQIPALIYDGHALTVRTITEGPYIAISHVWVDGLGSTTEDGLPACQVARIATYASQLVPDGAFWVDALCVPGARGLRKSAIILMEETYRKADKVVVFDEGIRTLCACITPHKEIFFRIATSSWMQRVWTLQEALLARELYFELSDGLLPLRVLESAYQYSMELVPSSLGPISRDMFMYEFVPRSLYLMFNETTTAWGAEQLTVELIANVVRLLRARTTSKREDETIAIAGLLGISVVPLLAESDASARMRVFLLELGTLPAGILVSPHPKMSVPGFRWAPQSLTSPIVLDWREDGVAHCTPEGLTTEREFGLILFPVVQLGGSEAHPEAIVLDNPKSEATYLIVGLRKKAGSRTMAMNGIVTALKAFPETIQEGSTTFAVAVHIAAPPADGGQGEGGQPVVCEHLLDVELRQMRSHLGSHATVEELVDEFKAPLIEGRFTSARITMT